MTKTCVLVIVDGLQPIYEDMMYMVKEKLERNGNECLYLYVQEAQQRRLLRNDDNTQCFFFGTKFLHPSVNIPDGSYLMDFDHAHWIRERYNASLVHHNHIITFSSHMMDDFRRTFGQDIPHIGLFRFGYTKTLDYGYIDSPTYEYDVCFLGTMSERRIELLSILQQKYRCFVHSHIYLDPEFATTQLGHIYRGRERAMLYQKSKIILSIAFTENYLQNTNASRIFPAVCTGAFVVAERSLDEEQNVDVDKICVHVPFQEMETSIDYYLTHDDERESHRREYYDTIRTMECDFPY